MAMKRGTEIIKAWPEQSQEAAQLVVDQYGEPNEASESLLIWSKVGPWKRMTASRDFHHHEFPIPHIDSVVSVIDYRVPTDKITPVAEFDGSVVVERTTGEVLARCHDEQANFLALNLMHDVVTGKKTVREARNYYAEEFLNYRRKEPTPYMQRLYFDPTDSAAADPDHRVLSDEDLKRAAEEGKKKP